MHPPIFERQQLVQALDQPRVSVVLPAYNEQHKISDSIRRVQSIVKDLDYEILVVDDGSRDDTRKRALEVADNSRIRVLSYGQNRGKGYAIKYGIAHAIKDSIVFLDSDLDIDPRSLLPFLDCVKSADLVLASKRHAGSVVEAPLMRRFLSSAFQTLVRILTGVKASDTQSGMKAGRASSLKKIFPLLSVKQYAFDVEMLAVAQLMGMTTVELPIRLKQTSRFSTKLVIRMMIDLLGISYRLHVKRWYQSNLNSSNPSYYPLIKW